MRSSLRRIALSAVSLLVTIGASAVAEAGLVISVNSPGVQASTVSGTTETFNGFSPGIYTSLNTAVGTVTAANGGQFAIVSADSYGGAGGNENYFAIGAQSGSGEAATLVLKNGPQGYFGFWLSAADAYNKVSLYSGNDLVGNLDTPLLLSTLAKLPDGSQYFGNPNNGNDAGEPFVYVNFTGTSGTTFTSIEFSNSHTAATGYESDNWSIASSAPTEIPGIIIAGANSIPEPSSLVLAGVACLLGTPGLRPAAERSQAVIISRGGKMTEGGQDGLGVLSTSIDS
jgi:hypothetical protein